MSVCVFEPWIIDSLFGLRQRSRVQKTLRLKWQQDTRALQIAVGTVARVKPRRPPPPRAVGPIEVVMKGGGVRDCSGPDLVVTSLP